jgi:hypothetical protein
MFITEVLFALVVAFVLSLIFSMGFRGYGWGMGFLMFFVILFLMTWAGGIWVTPFGPLWWGVPWVSFLFVGLLIALVMAALMPKNHRYRTGSPSEQEAKATSETLIAMDVFFWILMIAVVLLLIIGYATR